MKRLDVLEKVAFHTATFIQMVPQLMVLGTCNNLFICNGNNCIAKVIVVTTVWSTQRKREQHWVSVLSNIMVNGPSSVYLECRFVYINLCSLSVTFYTRARKRFYNVFVVCSFYTQEGASVALSLLNLAMHFRGWLSFSFFLSYKLPLRTDKKPYYEYAVLWHIYVLFSLNSWFWSAVFHTR